MSDTARSRSKEYTFAGMAAVTSANVGWGLTDNLIKILGRGQLITWVYGVSGSLFILGVLLVTREKLVWKDFIRSFPIGLQRAIVWSVLFIAFQEDNPAIAITVLSFSLVVSIIVFGPRLGEEITSKVIFLSIIGSFGLIMTSVVSFSDLQFSRGAILAVCVLPVAAAGTYVLRNVLKSVPSKPTALYMHVWVAILLTFALPFIHQKAGFTNKEVWLIVVMAVVGAGGHLINNYSQHHTTFRFNAIASTIHTPASAIFAWWLVGSTLLFHQIIGMVIVTGVVGYFAVTTRKPEIQELDENLAIGP